MRTFTFSPQSVQVYTWMQTVCRLSSIRSCGVKSRASFFISCADISRRVSFPHFGQVRLWLSICLRNLSLYHSITAAMAGHTGTSHSRPMRVRQANACSVSCCSKAVDAVLPFIIRKTKCSPLFKRSDISYKTKRPPKNNFPKYSRGSKKSTGKFCFSQCFFL